MLTSVIRSDYPNFIQSLVKIDPLSFGHYFLMLVILRRG